eukprot:1564062-Rhodomonas_salina.2
MIAFDSAATERPRGTATPALFRSPGTKCTGQQFVSLISQQQLTSAIASGLPWLAAWWSARDPRLSATSQ